MYFIIFTAILIIILVLYQNKSETFLRKISIVIHELLSYFVLLFIIQVTRKLAFFIIEILKKSEQKNKKK